MRDLLDLCRVCNIPGVAVLLDSEKAFDRVDHQFLFQALRKYGVSESFISWMELLNTGCQSRVVYNCTISLPFPIKRSVRQGSVEAPFLYAIYAGVISDYVIHKLRDKMLSLALRSGPQIVEPSLFADDTSIFLSDPNHIHALFEVYATVGRATNLKINEAKTSVLRLGPLRDADPPDGLAHLQWVPPDGTTRVLGVQLGYGDLAKANFEPLRAKVARALGRWSRHSLSIAGRVLIANAIGLSRVWYHCRCIHMPNTYSKALSDTVYNYLWKGRFSPVARKVVTAPPKTIVFGLGLIDLPTNIAATAAQALINFLSPVPSFWKLVVNHLAEVADRPARLSDYPVAEYTAMQRLVAKFPFRLSLSVFWHHAFRAWRRLLPFSEPPRSKNELLATPLWRNPMLDKIDFRMLRKHGISYLHHLHSGKKWQSARDLREFCDSRLPQVEARLQVIRSKVSHIDPSKLRIAPVRFRENDWVVDSWGFLRRILETPAADALSVRVKPYVFRLHVVSDWTSPSAKSHTKPSDLLMQLAEAYPPPKRPEVEGFFFGSLMRLDVDPSRLQLRGAPENMYRSLCIDKDLDDLRRTANRSRRTMLESRHPSEIENARYWLALYPKHIEECKKRVHIVRCTSSDASLRNLRHMLTPAPVKPTALVEWEQILGPVHWSKLRRNMMTNLVPRNRAGLIWRIAHNTEYLGEIRLLSRRDKLTNEQLREESHSGAFACVHCFRLHGTRAPLENWLHMIVHCPLAVAVWREAETLFSHAQGPWFPRQRSQWLFGPIKNKRYHALMKDEALACLTIVMHTARWTLWTLRCTAKFDNTVFTPADAVLRFRYLITLAARLEHSTIPLPNPWRTDDDGDDFGAAPLHTDEQEHPPFESRWGKAFEIRYNERLSTQLFALAYT
ncbi:hypothetical protein CAOG_09201 [Capsaspora owczarzaki ATCC 30864]|uniref:hypothetical protein n=1 Tax=Capsaspora owczarzaki (strain ATCC 30864) TaxID=595528 RepID=UPI000352197B|nr:hypothetical protein CAOG_09201 [Capsaspora owczarzaki ATCC 30864]|eukprot:XP_011270918.1 hypothetical protein CAOG_09201 [Capsaspora owczarzaki ATCC 30864]